MMPWGPSTPTRRLVTWGAGRGPPRCLPSDERRLVQPQRQVAPPAKPEVVLPPIANPILGPRDAMLARGVELERHDGLAQRVDGAARYPAPIHPAQPPCWGGRPPRHHVPRLSRHSVQRGSRPPWSASASPS